MSPTTGKGRKPSTKPAEPAPDNVSAGDEAESSSASGTRRRTARPEIDLADRRTWPELLTIPEAAEILGLSRENTRLLINDGEIEAAKIGGQWRISRRWLVNKFHLD